MFHAIMIHTSDPAKGAMTRTIPRSCLRGSSSRRRIHPEVPLDKAKKQKLRSLPLSNAIRQGTASTARITCQI
jgi:hypothetical protein